ncbi:MAG TPA: TIGR02996 domain-containing protein [Kofleriaceae bacterium]|nr:TIGR02996 domain-containing protein [Kofleriaceae bacterium]
MLAIYLYDGEGRTQRILSEKDEIWLGTRADVDIPLAGRHIAGRHCRLLVRPAGCFLVREGGEVKVNGKTIEKAAPLYTTDKVYVGSYSFMIESLERAPDVVEEKLLADIAAGDDPSRAVYADWLEENGDPRRAEFLRCQEMLGALIADDPETRLAFAEQARRLRQLATLVDLEWRMRVARAPVEACKVELRIELRCPKQWSDLVETPSPDVRFCELCRQQVFYCTTVAEARQHAWRGRCVAVDIANERTPHDLERPPPMVGMIAPR